MEYKEFRVRVRQSREGIGYVYTNEDDAMSEDDAVQIAIENLRPQDISWEPEFDMEVTEIEELTNEFESR